MLKAVPELIDIEKEDPLHHLRDTYILSCIADGATSVQMLNAVTYLAQFERLDSEFTTDPIFMPDFTIMNIPYSSSLIELLNHTNRRIPLRDSSNVDGLLWTDKEHIEREMPYFLERGGQVGRLYTEVSALLQSLSKEAIYSRTVDCVARDTTLREIFKYTKLP